MCKKPNANGKLCSAKTVPNCCGNSFLHGKGDQELVKFLEEEIETETKSQKHPKLPKIEGFDVVTDGAKVILTKMFNDEKITVKLNVNHTVDAESKIAEAPQPGAPEGEKEITEMKSLPNFTIQIEKNAQTIAFSCSFVQDYSPEESDDPDAFNDMFNIDEVLFHEGEWKENTYSVSGEIIDGYLYDLLMNTLEERGIAAEFAEKLSNFSTSYEHKLYIGLLGNLKKFLDSKK